MVGQNDELACVYAALILADDKVPITVIIAFKLEFLCFDKLVLIKLFIKL